MIEDQKYMLTQILQAVMREKPDGVLISGDVYDRTIPTAEAVQVLDAFLTSLSEQEVPVFIISGNHDSAERLAFGSNLMGKSGIYLSKVYDGRIESSRYRMHMERCGFIFFRFCARQPYAMPCRNARRRFSPRQMA